jgi:TonB family protein
MGKSMQTGDSPGSQSRSSGGGWRERWSDTVMVSTIAAAVAHAVLFAAWPAWEISQRFTSERTTMVQLEPVVTPGGQSEEGDSPSAVETTAAEPEELALDAGGTGSEEDFGDLLEFFGTSASLVNPVMASAMGPPGRSPPPLPPLILDQLEALNPRVTSGLHTVSWPLIRNPTVLQRFLRSRYNPIHRNPDAFGFVSVAMWINERGSVEWAEVRESSGHAALDAIALAAFNDVVVFAPARAEGSPVSVSVIISVPFNAPW